MARVAHSQSLLNMQQKLADLASSVINQKKREREMSEAAGKFAAQGTNDANKFFSNKRTTYSNK